MNIIRLHSRRVLNISRLAADAFPVVSENDCLLSLPKDIRMSQDLQVRVDMLERTLLDLGTQLFEVKGRLAKALEKQDGFQGLLAGLRHLLDEKGVLTPDDFDGAADLGGASAQINQALEACPDEWSGKTKKEGH